MLKVEYIGDKDWETEFSNEEKNFFHEHLGTMMFVSGIGVLAENSIKEFAFRVNHLRLMQTKITDEHIAFFSKYIPTRINHTTLTRLAYLRQKYKSEIGTYNNEWTKKVEKQRYIKSLKNQINLINK